MCSAVQEGDDHQDQESDPDGKGGETEALDDEVICDATGFMGTECLGDAHFLVTFPLVATLLDELVLRHLAVEDDEVHREFFRPPVGVEEVDGEDEAGGKQRLVRVDDGGYVEHPAREEQTEELGEPEHQAGAADGEHTPEDCDEVEFLPVGPAFEGRLRTFEEEPADHSGDILDVTQVRHERIGTEEPLQEVPLQVLTDEEEVDAEEDGSHEVDEGDARTVAVDQTRVRRAAKPAHQYLCPGLIAELEREPGHRQAEEADDNEQVEEDVAPLEASVLLVPVGNRMFDVPFFQGGLLLTVLDEAAEHPEECVQPEDCEGADQQACHCDECIEENRVLLTVAVLAVGIELSEQWGCFRVTLTAGVHEIVRINARIRIF